MIAAVHADTPSLQGMTDRDKNDAAANARPARPGRWCGDLDATTPRNSTGADFSVRALN